MTTALIVLALVAIASAALYLRHRHRGNPRCPKCGGPTEEAGFSPMAWYFRCPCCDS